MARTEDKAGGSTGSESRLLGKAGTDGRGGPRRSALRMPTRQRQADARAELRKPMAAIPPKAAGR
jgi:hypothetical protein